MAQKTIRETLNIIQSGDWFSCRVITCDVIKGIGGKVIVYDKCRIARNRLQTTKNNGHVTEEKVKKKDHQHNLHFTLNVQLPNNQIRKIHPILITHINNNVVI